MIRRREATRITLTCDVCQTQAHVYTSTPDGWVEYPEGWASYPDHRDIPDASDPQIILCPEHSHLQATARLITAMLRQTSRAVSLASSQWRDPGIHESHL